MGVVLSRDASFVVGFIFILLSIQLGYGAFLLASYLDNTEEIIISKIDCYDRYHNKIIGSVCEEKVYSYFGIKSNFSGLLGALILLATVFIGSLFFVLGVSYMHKGFVY